MIVVGRFEKTKTKKKDKKIKLSLTLEGNNEILDKNSPVVRGMDYSRSL